jgi:hypothetical protein
LQLLLVELIARTNSGLDFREVGSTWAYKRSRAPAHPIHEDADGQSELDQCRGVSLSVDRIREVAEQVVDLFLGITRPAQHLFGCSVRNQMTLLHQGGMLRIATRVLCRPRGHHRVASPRALEAPKEQPGHKIVVTTT